MKCTVYAINMDAHRDDDIEVIENITILKMITDKIEVHIY